MCSTISENCAILSYGSNAGAPFSAHKVGGALDIQHFLIMEKAAEKIAAWELASPYEIVQIVKRDYVGSNADKDSFFLSETQSPLVGENIKLIYIDLARNDVTMHVLTPVSEEYHE